MDEMETAHTRDYNDKAQLRYLRLTLLDFMDNPPRRLSPRSQGTVLALVGLLSEDEARITEAWG